MRKQEIEIKQIVDWIESGYLIHLNNRHPEYLQQTDSGQTEDGQKR